ncbi:MAG: hypothetical protein KatS3mg038_3505 [Candidatus Kapaibacterium sp.]|nr:MAG: hypothetical protein KatS3mg038_3505 [Candidatus Kapabacteria bacterium]
MAQDVVAWGIDFGAAWSRFAREWMVRHMPALMQVYVEQNFHTGMRPGLRLVNGRIVGRGRNRTSKLYVNTGRLARSFAPFAREGVSRVRGSVYEYGTRVPYAHRHEAGTFGMPRRPFLAPAIDAAIRDNLFDDVAREFVRYVAQRLGQHGP